MPKLVPNIYEASQAAPDEQLYALREIYGQLPSSYERFLKCMGSRCPFMPILDIETKAQKIVEYIVEFDLHKIDNFMLVGIDLSGSLMDYYLDNSARCVVRSSLASITLNPTMVTFSSDLESFFSHCFTISFLRSFQLRNSITIGEADDSSFSDVLPSIWSVNHFGTFQDLDVFAGPRVVYTVESRPNDVRKRLFFATTSREDYELFRNFTENLGLKRSIF